LVRSSNASPINALVWLTNSSDRRPPIAANVAEGCGRETKADFRRFLTIAIGSATETENHLIRAWQLKLISEAEFERLSADCAEVRRIIFGLRKSLQRTA
jgi:four helix bundle protein